MNKYSCVSIDLDEETYEVVLKIATSKGISVSDFIKECALSKIVSEWDNLQAERTNEMTHISKLLENM